VHDQSLPRGQARDRQARTHYEVDVARQRREVACFDGRILGQGAVAIPVCEAEHPLSHREPRGAITEGGDHSGQLVPGDRGRSVTVEAIGPGRRPTQLSVNESRGVNLNDNVVDRWLWLGPLHQLHPGRSRSLVRHHYRLHLSPPCKEGFSHWLDSLQAWFDGCAGLCRRKHRNDLEIDEVAPVSHPLIEEPPLRALHDLEAPSQVSRDPAIHVLQPIRRETALLTKPSVYRPGVAPAEVLDDEV